MFVGGVFHHEQEFNVTGAQTETSLLALAISSLLIPAAFNAALGSTDTTNGVLPISRGTAVILLLIYIMYFLLTMLISGISSFRFTPILRPLRPSKKRQKMRKRIRKRRERPGEKRQREQTALSMNLQQMAKNSLLGKKPKRRRG
jgi:Ca2+:H+ antiporter